MLTRSYAWHHYSSVHRRFAKQAIEDFFKLEFPRFFGPSIRSTIADNLMKIFSEIFIDINTLKPGQILWRAVHKDTRADSPYARFVPVVLTLVSEEDVAHLEDGMKISQHRQNVIARITWEAYQQDALLSMRDISLFFTIQGADISKSRIQYEKAHNVTLPHTGSLHDAGSCLTHKYQIVYKYIVENKDPVIIAKETNHSIKAVDHYLKDFNRVKTLYLDNKNVQYIHQVTNMSLNVINQYVSIIKQYIKEPGLVN